MTLITKCIGCSNTISVTLKGEYDRKHPFWCKDCSTSSIAQTITNVNLLTEGLAQTATTPNTMGFRSSNNVMSSEVRKYHELKALVKELSK